MRVLVAGGGGFIGGHLVKRLLNEGHDVRAADIKPADRWWQQHSDCENLPNCDLRWTDSAWKAVVGTDHVYNLASNMGGMGFIGSHKADCMLSVLISGNLLWAARKLEAQRTFFSSSACIYPERCLTIPGGTPIREDEAYPADPMDGYGWEKLFTERMSRHFTEDYGLETRVARFDPIYGPHGDWDGGREKAPAAMCRKVAIAKLTGTSEIEVWGDGKQTRTFCYIDDAVDGIRRIMDSTVREPVNLSSSETVTINHLIDTVATAANAQVVRKHVDGPQGARGRSADNRLLRTLGWTPRVSLADGIAQTYEWVEQQVIREGIAGGLLG